MIFERDFVNALDKFFNEHERSGFRTHRMVITLEMLIGTET